MNKHITLYEDEHVKTTAVLLDSKDHVGIYFYAKNSDGVEENKSLIHSIDNFSRIYHELINDWIPIDDWEPVEGPCWAIVRKDGSLRVATYHRRLFLFECLGERVLEKDQISHVKPIPTPEGPKI